MDLGQLLTFRGLSYLSIIFIYFYFVYKILNTRQVYHTLYRSLLWLIIILFFWVCVSILNLITLISNVSLWGTRLAFAVVPWAIILIQNIIIDLGEIHDLLIKRLSFVNFMLVTLLSILAVFDKRVIQGSVTHTSIIESDIPLLGTHFAIYVFLSVLMITLLFGLILQVIRKVKSMDIKLRIKIISYFLTSSVLVLLIFNLFLPLLGIKLFFTYGILSSLLVVFGFYIALEDNWVYSISYLISKHVFIWIAGIILFVSVKFFEILMSHVFGWNITNFSDINADLFGILLGIIVAYISLTLIKYSETIGLALIYPSFLKFRHNFNKTIHKSIDEKVVPSEILKEILMLIVKFLKIQNACFTDLDSMLAHTYKICINDKQDLTLDYIRIPILKKRYLVLIGKNFFAPKEFIEFFLTKTLTINSLINLDITSTTLKSINTQLARAVVTRTNKLEKKLEQVSHNFSSLKNEFSDCKRLFPSIFGNVLFNVKMSFDYLKIIENKIPDDYDLRFNITRLHEQLINIKGVLHKVVIFSDVVMNNKVYRQKFDIKAHLFKLLDAWQPQFDNKSIGIIRDLEPGKVLLPYDYDKIDFIFNTIIGYMLINLRHGYLQAVQRNDLGKVSFNFKAVGQPKETGYSPVMDEKLVSSMETSLMLMERIVKLHNGTFSYIFQNTILYDVTFNLSKL